MANIGVTGLLDSTDPLYPNRKTRFDDYLLAGSSLLSGVPVNVAVQSPTGINNFDTYLQVFERDQFGNLRLVSENNDVNNINTDSALVFTPNSLQTISQPVAVPAPAVGTAAPGTATVITLASGGTITGDGTTNFVYSAGSTVNFSSAVPVSQFDYVVRVTSNNVLADTFIGNYNVGISQEQSSFNFGGSQSATVSGFFGTNPVTTSVAVSPPASTFNLSLTETTDGSVATGDSATPSLPGQQPGLVVVNFPLGAGSPSAAVTGEAPNQSVTAPDGTRFYNLSDNADSVILDSVPASQGQYVRGLGGNDDIQGTAQNDTINGNQGTDTIRGGSGRDLLLGGMDNDFVSGDVDDDTVNGNRGNDTVLGGAGNDVVNGGMDNDILFGEEGNDTLSGDFGQDSLVGGADGDLFILRIDSNGAMTNTSSNVGEVDIISDFNPVEGDRIGLKGGLAFENLTFETFQTAINGALSTSTAIRVNRDGDPINGQYLAIVQGVSAATLQSSTNFIQS
jgi:Ca2+-binding RTX toxin-like protein